MTWMIAACAVLSLGLSGCAAPPQALDAPTEAELIATAGNAAVQDGHQMTGSRLKDRTSTDRMLKAVGAQGAKDEMRNAPRPGAMTQ